MRVLAMASQKGGSGKTTLSGHLAVQAQLAGRRPGRADRHRSARVAVRLVERASDEYPAFAQTTVARLAADLEVLRQQGFKLAVIDTPPAITMAIQSVIQVAELIVIPTRPQPARSARRRRHGRSVRARRQAADLRRQRRHAQGAGSPREAAVALSQHGTVAPITIHHRTDFAASMIDGRTVMEVDPNGRSADEVARVVGLYLRPARKEFPPHRVRRADQRAVDLRHAAPGRGRRLRPPRGELRGSR